MTWCAINGWMTKINSCPFSFNWLHVSNLLDKIILILGTQVNSRQSEEERDVQDLFNDKYRKNCFITLCFFCRYWFKLVSENLYIFKVYTKISIDGLRLMPVF
jgi:hypothetical protein